MPAIVDYPMSSGFGGVYQVQAAGIVDTGAAYSNGVGDSLSIVGGVMRATVRDTDPETALGQRAEIRAPSDGIGEFWYAWEFMIPDSWDDTKSMSIMQIHDSPDGGDAARFPNFLLTIESGAINALVPSATLPTEGASGVRVARRQLTKNHWYSGCLHVSWQAGATGFRELFIDREATFREFNVPTHYVDVTGPYLKLGVYDFYHAGGFGTKSAYFRNLAVWAGRDGYASVMGGVPTARRNLLRM